MTLREISVGTIDHTFFYNNIQTSLQYYSLSSREFCLTEFLLLTLFSLRTPKSRPTLAQRKITTRKPNVVFSFRHSSLPIIFIH
jgi:hypothetical protein